ncbi:extensin-like [Gigantopelta aegis]|uniref:extensin-like n=1 Tax=Gigantopelta aegis TaxID=1735272 RepID=UPI001B888571|nr:extensin-like [Gigantopelta aegis]
MILVYGNADSTKTKSRRRTRRKRTSGAAQRGQKLAAQPPAAVPSALPPSPRPVKPAQPEATQQPSQLDVTTPLLDPAICETPRPASPVPTRRPFASRPPPPGDSAVTTLDVGAAKRKAVTPTSDQPAKAGLPQPLGTGTPPGVSPSRTGDFKRETSRSSPMAARSLSTP